MRKTIGIIVVFILIGAIIGITYYGLGEGGSSGGGTGEGKITIQSGDPWELKPTDIQMSDTAMAIIEVPIVYDGGGDGWKYVMYINDNDVTYYLWLVSEHGLNPFIKIGMSQVGSGEKILTAKVLTKSGTVICSDSITIVVPDHWEFEYSTVGKASTGEGIDRNYNTEWWLGMNPPTIGIITRIKGEYFLDLLGNDPCEVWFDFYDPCNYQWHDAVYIDENPVHGWNPVDFNLPGDFRTDWWGIAGCHWWNDPDKAYNQPQEFKGTIYMKPGYWYCDINPLSFLLKLFGDSKDSPSGPGYCSSC